MRPLFAAALLLSVATCAPQSDVPLYQDLGSLHRTVTTSSRDAQAYFDQGLRLYYGFNQAEAVRAFAEAARLDTSCAMCWAGLALAWGPNINIPMDSAGAAHAHAALQHAVANRASASPAEQVLIDALVLRYPTASLNPRAGPDSAYQQAMAAAAARDTRDVDLQVLAAEAAMQLRPWDYWRPDGSPYPGTTEFVRLLEGAVASDSMHPGACHFYIHAVEKLQPQLAVPCAERLAALMPGAGHLVHMPAHIYFRVGRYADAVAANEHASHADSVYIEGQKPSGLYPMFYTPHNHHFRAAAAMMEGQSEAAISAARETARLTPVENVRAAPPIEIYRVSPLYMMARFEKWDDILREPQPAADLVFSTGVWHYVRGLAHNAQGRADSAAAASRALAEIADKYPADAVMGLNAGKSQLYVASHALQGEIAARAGRTAEAERHFKAAITVEDQLTYNEPPDWYYPVRQSLAAALLAGGRAADAERVSREDLQRYPGNGWSLRTLAAALDHQGKRDEAQAARTELGRAWARADAGMATTHAASH